MKSGMLPAKLAEFIADGNLFEGDVSALPADSTLHWYGSGAALRLLEPVTWMCSRSCWPRLTATIFLLMLNIFMMNPDKKEPESNLKLNSGLFMFG